MTRCPNCDSTRILNVVQKFLDCVWESMKCYECGYTETRDVRVPVKTPVSARLVA